MRELKIAAAVLITAGILVATTPSDEPDVQARSGFSGFAADDATGPGSSTTTSVDRAAGATGSTPVRGQTGSSGPESEGVGSPTPDSAAGSTGATGPGITDDTITVGMGWFDVNAAVAALAAPGVSEGNYPTTKEGAQRIVDWVNANGGIAGRKVIPAYHEFPIQEVATNDSRDRREQAMCSDWTEDHVAFAAIPYQDGQGVFYKCAADHGLIGLSTFTSGGGAMDGKWFDEIGGTFWAPNWIKGERRERVVVEQLDRLGFFEPGARVGLLLGDVPQARSTANSTLKPMLAERGVNVVAEVYTRDLSDPWQSHAFQFQQARVTHIVAGQSSCGAGICLALFQQAAENQRYRPKYGVGSDWGAGQADVYQPPAAQMANTVSIGWSPRTDVDTDAYNVAEPINDYDALCRKIIKDSGLEIPMHLVTPYCDGLFFLRDGLERAPELTWQGFRQGIESADDSIVVGTAYGTRFGPGRHDGSSYVRDMRWDPETGEWSYTGPPIPIG